MTVYRWLIVALWLGLIAYWTVAAAGAKPASDRAIFGKESAYA